METIATVIFPRVKISWVRAKAHLVFHWCLYSNILSFTREVTKARFKRQTSHAPNLMQKIYLICIRFSTFEPGLTRLANKKRAYSSLQDTSML